MTANLLLHGYYYRGKSHRQLVKNLIQLDNDIVNAKIKLETAIAEHDNYINSRNISGENFTIEDNLSLHHAKDHIEFALENETQKQATIDALGE